MMPVLKQAFLSIHTEQASVIPKHFLVLGLGESGLAMVNWCLQHGATVDLADTRSHAGLSNQQQETLETLKESGLSQLHLGDWTEGDLGRQLEVICAGVSVIGISPGLSPIQEPLKTILTYAQSHGIAVWSEIEFFARALTALQLEFDYQPTVLAITGTNGKTTTTALTQQICERAGKNVAMAGNISPAALSKLSACLDGANTILDLPEIWVLELSSFQLQYTESLNATAVAILNITQDHLDWHGDMQAYIQAKAKIIGTNSICILNRDDPLVSNIRSPAQQAQQSVITFGVGSPTEPGSFGIEHDLRAGGIDWLVWAEIDEELEAMPKRRRKAGANELSELRLKRLIPADALRIRGRHNALNALAALALARCAGLPMNMLLHGLREYQGEPHRVQSLAVIDGVEYVDDSKGTNVGATAAALNGLGATTEGKHIWLIAGGDGKGQDFSPLREPVLRFVKGLILIGKDAAVIRAALADCFTGNNIDCVQSDSLSAAAQFAFQHAQLGDIVLLSPACASFDQFRDYKHRAEVFASAVAELAMQFSSTNQAVGATV